VSLGRALTQDVKNVKAQQAERRRLYDQANPAVKRRLAAVAARSPEKPLTKETKALGRKLDKATLEARKKVVARLNAAKAKQAEKTGKADKTDKAKKKKAFTSKADKRIPPEQGNAYVENGRVSIWKGRTVAIDQKQGFRVTNDPKHSYGVKVGDESVTLNTHKNRVRFGEETVRGLPTIHKYDKDTPNKKVVDDLYVNMGYVDSWDKKKVAVPAPFADSKDWKVDDKYKPVKGLGQLQLHHVNQWYKNDVTQISKDVESGKISLDQGKALMRENLRPNPKVRSGYEIAVTDPSKREYVVLPAGLHDLSHGQKLYDANHPKGIHPDTGKLESFGIPTKAHGSTYGEINGRQYHDKVRDAFWSEVRRHEIETVIVPELNKRLADGRLSKDEFDELWGNRFKDKK
jgi:hypothetical protein